MTSSIAYLTDVEGQWDKLATFAADNPLVSLQEGRLLVAAGALLVFGGDAMDRGPAGWRVVRTLLEAKCRQPTQVVLLAGNRDINKLRLLRELRGHPPTGAAGRRGPELLRWILQNTMGAGGAFAHRQAELGGSDAEVTQSFIDDVAPGGLLREYLAHCQLAFRWQTTLFVHGGVTEQSLGMIPGRANRLHGVDAWIAGLNAFYREQLGAFVEGRTDSLGEPQWNQLIAYQAPISGTKLNQASVVYGRPTDELGNPLLPGRDVVERLRRDGVRRLVLGHTPSGDCPAILRDRDFQLILADNSYGRLESGSQVFLEPERTRVDGFTVLDSGERLQVRYEVAFADDGLLGARLGRHGPLIKAALADGRLLLFRAHPAYRVEQWAESADDLARQPLTAPYPQHRRSRPPRGA